MIGQKALKAQFDTFVNLPRVIMLVGENGSGRKTFAYWFADKKQMPIVLVGDSADDIRALTQVKLNTDTFYLIPNIDRLSVTAQNSLLKILEEPPTNMYFIVTTIQESLVLPTIQSRCMRFVMCNYSKQELEDYARGEYKVTDTDLQTIDEICTCPGEIQTLMKYDVPEFLNYVKLVYKNIAKVSGANSFKISGKVNLADDDKKYELGLFWKAFTTECLKDLKPETLKAVQITSKYYSELRIKGVNKQMMFDNWILDIRKAWM